MKLVLRAFLFLFIIISFSFAYSASCVDNGTYAYIDTRWTSTACCSPPSSYWGCPSHCGGSSSCTCSGGCSNCTNCCATSGSGGSLTYYCTGTSCAVACNPNSIAGCASGTACCTPSYKNNCDNTDGCGGTRTVPSGYNSCDLSSNTSCGIETTLQCDGKDNDCDGVIDDGDACACSVPQSSTCTATDLENHDCYSCADGEYFDVNNMRYCFNYNILGATNNTTLLDQNNYCKGLSFSGYSALGLANFKGNVNPSSSGANSERLAHILTVKSNYSINRQSPINLLALPRGLYIADKCSQTVADYPKSTYNYLYADGGKIGVIDCSVEGLAFSVGNKGNDENGRLNDVGTIENSFKDLAPKNGAVCQFKKTSPLNCFYCTGEIDLTGMSVICPGDDANLLANTTRTLVNSQTDCSAGTKCQYYCKPGYSKIGNNCVSTTPSCTGSVDLNAMLCDLDDKGLSGTTTIEVVESCTDGKKCEYYCKEGYVLSGGSCVLAPQFHCEGVPPSNAVLCSGDDTGLFSNAPYSLKGSTSFSCTLAEKCEYYCASGYDYNNGVCSSGTNGFVIDPTGGKQSITSFVGKLDGNMVFASISCSSALTAGLLMKDSNGSTITIDRSSVTCPITSSDFNLKISAALNEKEVYTLTATIAPPCDICERTLYLSQSGKEITVSIPDNSPALALIIAAAASFLLLFAGKSTRSRK